MLKVMFILSTQELILPILNLKCMSPKVLQIINLSQLTSAVLSLLMLFVIVTLMVLIVLVQLPLKQLVTINSLLYIVQKSLIGWEVLLSQLFLKLWIGLLKIGHKNIPTLQVLLVCLLEVEFMQLSIRLFRECTNKVWLQQQLLVTLIKMLVLEVHHLHPKLSLLHHLISQTLDPTFLNMDHVQISLLQVNKSIQLSQMKVTSICLEPQWLLHQLLVCFLIMLLK